jgi:Plasmid pRiA4b ORF-3-like protein
MILVSLAAMHQANSFEIYQFRAVLRETSLHIWRRLSGPSDCTLIAFNRILQTAFGWSGHRTYSFAVQGHRKQAASVTDPGRIALSDLQVYLN